MQRYWEFSLLYTETKQSPLHYWYSLRISPTNWFLLIDSIWCIIYSTVWEKITFTPSIFTVSILLTFASTSKAIPSSWVSPYLARGSFHIYRFRKYQNKKLKQLVETVVVKVLKIFPGWKLARDPFLKWHKP